MKYKDRQSAEAVYTEEKGNPFLEAVPDFLGKEDFNKRIQSRPAVPYGLEEKSPQERRNFLSTLSSWFHTMDYMYTLYDMLYRAMVSTYQTKTVADSVRQINTIYLDFRTGRERSMLYSTQAYSGAILGVPGIGKTSTIRRCLGTMPQVITHVQYQGEKFYTKQINYLLVECPSDCSVKTLSFNIFSAIDRAIGSEYFSQMANMRSVAASAVTTKLKIICMNHHVGLIVIDEIQNAILTATRNKQVKPLVKFLVELTNETNVGICFCGTLEAEEVFSKQEHLKRRTRGLRLLPLKYDVTYRKFITELWENQYTLEKTKLTEKLMKQIYDLSGGIPAYIVKIFQEAQAQAILSGKEKLSYEVIKQAVILLGIEVPRVYSRGGTSISDFSVEEVKLEEIGIGDGCEDSALDSTENQMDFIETIEKGIGQMEVEETGIGMEGSCGPQEEQNILEQEVIQTQILIEAKIPTEPHTPTEPQVPIESPEPVKRFYATRRGRPEKERDATDLLCIWKKDGSTEGMIKILESFHMIERRCFSC